MVFSVSLCRLLHYYAYSHHTRLLSITPAGQWQTNERKQKCHEAEPHILPFRTKVKIDDDILAPCSNPFRGKTMITARGAHGNSILLCTHWSFRASLIYAPVQSLSHSAHLLFPVCSNISVNLFGEYC